VRVPRATRDMFLRRQRKRAGGREIRFEAAPEWTMLMSSCSCDLRGDASRATTGSSDSRRAFIPYSFSMVPRPQSSAAGVLALLVEQEPLVKQHALNALISLVPQFWAEISEHIALMYVL
jgi:hypothetical protein